MLIALLVAVFGFGVRYLAHRDFANEQFIALSQAQAWLAGDWPIRDYTEPGMILTDGLSAAAQKLFGPTPLSELVLCVGALAAAAAVTFLVTTRMTSRRWLGAFAALLQIWAGPVLFSYPKILIYPVLLALGLVYARRQTWPPLILLAAWTAIAFLIRQDDGAYAFIGGFLLVAVVHQIAGNRTLALARAGFFSLAFLLFLTPFFLYVQAEMGLRSYFGLGIEMSRLEAQRSFGTIPSFRIEGGSLLVVKPPPDRDVIRILWSTDATEEARRTLEQRGHLLFGRLVEGRTWAYRIDRDSLEALASVFDDPAVEVVEGINRNTLGPPEESSLQRLLRVTKVDRLDLGPPIRSLVSQQNVTAFLFYSCYLFPGVALVLWGLAFTRTDTGSEAMRPLLPALCVMSVICAVGFVRTDMYRLPDVFGTFPIVFCCVIAMVLRDVGTPRRQLASRSIAVVLIGTVALGTYRIGGDYLRVVQIGAFHPLDALVGATETTRSARDWPWAAQWPGDEEWRLAKYVHDCTRADDRLLVTWQAPEFFYFSRRVFAGREGALLRRLRPPATYEQQLLDTWEHQSVPIALTTDESDAEFAAAFPALEHHLETAYAVAGTTTWPGRPSIIVHVDRNREPVRTDPQFGLPCFAAAG